MKIVSIVGARPQFIKASVVSKEIRKRGIKEVLVHTGQHYDFNMSEIFFKELEFPLPKYNLGIGSGKHGEQTGEMLKHLEKILIKERPDMVIVDGDTNSRLAGALAASKLQIPVAHVEAGLRSYNKKMPEEINRIMTDHVSTLLFAPTNTAVINLKNESLIKNVHVVGDVMFDVAMQTKKIVKQKEVLDKYGLEKKNFVLATIHRAENTDNRENLDNIYRALIDIAKRGARVFFPVHPRTEKALKKYGFLSYPGSKYLSRWEPVSYFEMNVLERNARIIVTDSGGVQKEGYFFRTPCVITRSETEWTELVDLKWNRVTGCQRAHIVTAAMDLWDSGTKDLPKWKDFFGGGKASKRIVDIIESFKY